MVRTKIAFVISFFIAFCASLVPFNYIVGSKFAWFSLSSMVWPAIGSYYSLLYVILYICTKSLWCKPVSYLFFMHKVPLLFSSFALKQVHWVSYIACPIIAMFLFCIHPVGGQVWYYSWLWLIPIMICFSGNQSLIARALASSCIAHACGSVVWLYTSTISVQTWNALMPIVPIERLFIMFGMIGFVVIFDSVTQLMLKRELV